MLHTRVFRIFLISDFVLTTTSILAGVLSTTDAAGGEPAEPLLYILLSRSPSSWSGFVAQV